MGNKSKAYFSKRLTEKALYALLAFSFVCTVLGFGIAYNEHRNLTALSAKYNEAIEKIDACEEALSSLSQKIDNLQTTKPYEYPVHNENPSEESNGNDTSNPSYSGESSASSGKTDNSSPVTDSKYYITQSGSKYHIASCSYLKKSRIPISLETIKAKGYSPCSRCIK